MQPENQPGLLRGLANKHSFYADPATFSFATHNAVITGRWLYVNIAISSVRPNFFQIFYSEFWSKRPI